MAQQEAATSMKWQEALKRLDMASSPLEELLLVSYNHGMPWFSVGRSFYYLLVRRGSEDYEYNPCALMRETELMDLQQLRWRAGLPQQWILPGSFTMTWHMMSVDQLLAWNTWRFDHPNHNSVEDWTEWRRKNPHYNGPFIRG